MFIDIGVLVCNMFMCTVWDRLVQPDSLDKSFLELIPKSHTNNILSIEKCTVCMCLYCLHYTIQDTLI